MASSSPRCVVCGETNAIMKRCTRCHAIFYCGRDCQVKDWPTHKLQCGIKPTVVIDKTLEVARNDLGTSEFEEQLVRQFSTKSDIFDSGADDDGCVTRSDNNNTSTSRLQNINFKGALEDLKAKRKSASSSSKHPSAINGASDALGSVSKETNSILDGGEHLSDGPKFTITVKANKVKYFIDLQEQLSGREMMCVISKTVQVPLPGLKVIHKGKLITTDNIKAAVRNKAIFQVIGEQAENEEGLVTEDIDIIMKQLSVERNVAIKALREKGDVVDAILYITNK